MRPTRKGQGPKRVPAPAYDLSTRAWRFARRPGSRSGDARLEERYLPIDVPAERSCSSRSNSAMSCGNFAHRSSGDDTWI